MRQGAPQLPQKKACNMLKRESNQNWMKARVCHSLPGRLRLTATGCASCRITEGRWRRRWRALEACAAYGSTQLSKACSLNTTRSAWTPMPRRNMRKWHSPALPWTPCAPATALPRTRMRRRACPLASSPAAWRSTQERCCWAIRRCAARRGRGGLASSPACRR